MIELNDELRQAVNEHLDEPVQLVDAATRETFVLVRSKVYDRLKGLFYQDSDFPIAEAYPLMDQVLAKSGWDDPAMDIYNDFAPKEQP